jgi:hypothetical protein
MYEGRGSGSKSQKMYELRNIGEKGRRGESRVCMKAEGAG